MEILRMITKHFNKKLKVPTEKRPTAEGKDTNIEETTRIIEAKREENEDGNIDQYQYRRQQSLHPPLTKRRSSKSDLLAQRKREHQEQLKENFDGTTSKSRAQTMSCNSYFMNDPRLTENAKDLSQEQMLALELDVLKPLDFFEILFNRMQAKDNGEEEIFGTVYHLS